jgi:lipopolysaccharide export system permease protein
LVLERNRALSLISRYVLREAFGASLLVVTVLLAILMSNQFAEILGDAATNAVPKDAIFEVFRWTFLRYLTLFAPISVLLGIMLALARLNRDSEMAALAACGIGPAQLLVPIGALTVVLAAFTAWLALAKMPEASRRIEEIRVAARAATDLAALEPGRFTTTDSGRTVLYAREVEGNQLRDVFIQGEREGRIVVVTAERGERVREAQLGEATFVLYNGRRTEGTPGEAEFLVAEFAEHGIPISLDVKEEPIESAAAQPTRALLGSTDPIDRAELQFRLSAPLSLLVLGFFAVPLSRSAPREGRYARIGAGLLIYLTYTNTLAIARISVERGEVPDWLGMWWVHGVLALGALVMLLKQSGALTRSRPFVYDSRTRHEPTA